MPKPTKQDYIDVFNASISQSGYSSEYPKLLKRVLGQDHFSGMPDVDLFIDDHKKDPNGAEKFAKYMLQQRPSGHLWMRRERAAKTDKQMKDIFRKESQNKLIKKIISESEIKHRIVFIPDQNQKFSKAKWYDYGGKFVDFLNTNSNFKSESSEARLFDRFKHRPDLVDQIYIYYYSYDIDVKKLKSAAHQFYFIVKTVDDKSVKTESTLVESAIRKIVRKVMMETK